MGYKWNAAFEKAGAGVGDKVRITLEGTVDSKWGDFHVLLPDGETWNIEENHVVTILEKAKPKEPTEMFTVIEGSAAFGTFRYVKLDTGWALLNSWGAGTRRSWDWLLEKYGSNIRVFNTSTPLVQA